MIFMRCVGSDCFYLCCRLLDGTIRPLSDVSGIVLRDVLPPWMWGRIKDLIPGEVVVIDLPEPTTTAGGGA